MGRGKFKGKGRGGGHGGRQSSHRGNRDNRNRNTPFQSFADIVRENPRLESYYNSFLGLDDDERVQFWATLRRELPNSFRFCGSKGHALAVKKLLQRRYIPEIAKITQFDGQPVSPPEPVPWYPDSLAWWMTTPKNVVRKFPPFAAFQRFLVSETTVGNISRQEVVSMIPPLLMDVRPGMTVLDLCAAPGSKASQLLEMIHAGEESRLRKVLLELSGEGQGAVQSNEEIVDAAELAVDTSDDGRATGLLIANDSDYKRCHLLTHQLKRLSSPNMIVTNHDATMYPQLRIPNPDDPSQPRYLKFDRILADVPCSGDGTLRKNIDLWKNWQPATPLGLHISQVRILVRALQMLKVGGRVVYSTCSMNPVENEAVVAAAIDRCGGLEKIDLIDCQDKIPKLLRKPGLKSWLVVDKSNRMWKSWEEVEEFTKSNDDGLAPSKVVESMFPGHPGSECADLPLERCMRVYPHLQDTGGFFITVLEKKAEFKAKPEEVRKQEPQPSTANGFSHKRRREENEGEETEDVKRQRKDLSVSADDEVEDVVSAAPTSAAPTTVSDPASAAQPVEPKANGETIRITPQPERKRKPDGPYEEPFKYLPTDNSVIQSVTRFYGLSPRFPTDRYLVRNAMREPVNAIYYTSALVRDILTLNEGRSVRFIHAGVRMFMKQNAPSAEVCGWRIQSEGLPILHAYIGPGRIVVLRRKETLRRLLVEMFPKIADGLWADLAEIGDRVRDIGMGCCVLRVEPDGSDEDFTERMALPVWKSFQSLNLMLPKEDRSAMLLRIFNDTSPLINMTLKEKSKAGRDGEKSNGKSETKEESRSLEVKGNGEEAFANGGPVEAGERDMVDEHGAEGDPAPEDSARDEEDGMDEETAYIAEDAPSD